MSNSKINDGYDRVYFARFADQTGFEFAEANLPGARAHAEMLARDYNTRLVGVSYVRRLRSNDDKVAGRCLPGRPGMSPSISF